MKKTLFVLLVVLVSALLAAWYGWIYYISPFDKPGEGFEYRVSEDQSVRSVAEDLEEKGVVKSSRILLLWLKLRDMDKSIKAGEEVFYPGEGVASAAEKLTLMRPVEITLTVPEGLTIWQTSSKISEYTDIDTSLFNSLCTDTSFIRSIGFKGIGSLEGYLFPETYRFPEDVSSEEIIKRMTLHLEEFFSSMGVSDRVNHLSMHQILTLASIVEDEATLASERRRIAGVFVNRLERGIPLGADPTVRYALRKFSGPLLKSELRSDSPYNTRVRKGLPPGPICSPGKGAIMAAANPMDTDELYFVAKWDGSGAHSFSVTNSEHERKKHEIRRRNRIRKRRLKDDKK